MKKPAQVQRPPRIITIWEGAGIPAQEAYHALCRYNDRGPGATLQPFALHPTPTRPNWMQTIKDWKPDGALVHTEKWDRLKKLRRALPGVPFVSTLIAPPGAVDTCVVTDIAEIMEQARDHFQSRGVRNLGLYCCADNRQAIESRTTSFRRVVPNGFELIYDRGDQPGGRKPIYAWLKSLPKPVGILAAELVGGPFLLGCCIDIGLRVPEEVQLIGVDAADECLAQSPHLTSFELPGQRVGKVALDTILRHVRKEKPAPPPILYVSGSQLVIRASTALVRAGWSAATTAIRHIQQNTAKDLPVERLAKLAGVGRTTFYKEFEKATGKSPARHLREMRLQKACRMLRDTSDTVTDIAKACGFKSLIYFAQFFRREMGETPTAYRKKGKIAHGITAP